MRCWEKIEAANKQYDEILTLEEKILANQAAFTFFNRCGKSDEDKPDELLECVKTDKAHIKYYLVNENMITF